MDKKKKKENRFWRRYVPSQTCLIVNDSTFFSHTHTHTRREKQQLPDRDEQQRRSAKLRTRNQSRFGFVTHLLLRNVRFMTLLFTFSSHNESDLVKPRPTDRRVRVSQDEQRPWTQHNESASLTVKLWKHNRNSSLLHRPQNIWTRQKLWRLLRSRSVGLEFCFCLFKYFQL